MAHSSLVTKGLSVRPHCCRGPYLRSEEPPKGSGRRDLPSLKGVRHCAFVCLCVCVRHAHTDHHLRLAGWLGKSPTANWCCGCGPFLIARVRVRVAVPASLQASTGLLGGVEAGESRPAEILEIMEVKRTVNRLESKMEKMGTRLISIENMLSTLTGAETGDLNASSSGGPPPPASPPVVEP
jgi:hypothetical protein